MSAAAATVAPGETTAAPGQTARERENTRLAEAIEAQGRGMLWVVAYEAKLCAVVGVLAGLSEVGFEGLLCLADWVFFDLIHEQLLSELPGWRILILPALGGLLIGPIVTRFARET